MSPALGFCRPEACREEAESREQGVDEQIGADYSLPSDSEACLRRMLVGKQEESEDQDAEPR